MDGNDNDWWAKGAKHLQEELEYVGVSKDLDSVHRIQFLAERKFNGYDQYLPGETFQNRLIKWLINFAEKDRSTALEIVENLIFFDNHELRALAVSTFWSSIKAIHQELFKQASTKRVLQVHLEKRKEQTVKALKRSLYVAVADDVMFDYFRRRAQRRVPEFVKDNFVEYYKLHEKCQMDDLNNLEDIDRIFLIDQLCGSGTSFLRKEDDAWKGKIVRLFEIWKNLESKEIYYMPYIMSHVADAKVTENLKSWQDSASITQEIKITPTIRIPVSRCLSSSPDGPIDQTLPVAKLCKDYFNPCILDEHIHKGGECRWGFGSAGLALILSSNCPNNTMPVIWCDCGDWYPLFPRIEHHP